ncbi:type 1 glutamine amidotransferase [Hydrotalea sandarakina]|jgi:GMP synthase-like glutamine amidotransferase|uniref:GMP synthase-like glutamine amidotransferase n=1 Tax=Hydrotalea sandarakina TaxID=1004304 RepID=A0A2W7S3J3_9BACT|nr:GMP synthase [Hydrotalea sandarakina]PZX61867.1 GMP synthase-like glutamine amidotransferase [Hydrotalea sandarakina]
MNEVLDEKRIAILDLYNGEPNEGMRCIKDLVAAWGIKHNTKINMQVFNVRQNNAIPNLNFDAYISSGGPGSPLESEGSDWDNTYIHWLRSVEQFNNNTQERHKKKHILFICHSFQLACRHYKVGTVCERKSTSFGVFPVHMLPEGKHEPIFNGLHDPFYAVDSRDFQVIKPNHEQIKKMGGAFLAIEKERPHVPYERALMAVRFNDCFVGTQFHPEADAVGMQMYLQRADKKKAVIDEHGEAKWESMVAQLQDPDKIMYTYNHIIPNFLSFALKNH